MYFFALSQAAPLFVRVKARKTPDDDAADQEPAKRERSKEEAYQERRRHCEERRLCQLPDGGCGADVDALCVVGLAGPFHDPWDLAGTAS